MRSIKLHALCTIRGYNVIMNRRKFISTAGILALYGSTKILYSSELLTQKEHKTLFEIIFTVQRHFFPKGLHMPDADTFGATEYLKEAVFHNSFDPDTRAVLFEGAKRVEKMSYGRFQDFSFEKKEKLLRRFEESSFGSYWLSRIMDLTLEALFADPVYGGNTNETGWKSFNLLPGNPRPKKRYCGV